MSTETDKAIAEWLQNESEGMMKQAMSRRDYAGTMRRASAKELRSAKSTAEKMSGHKLTSVKATVEEARAGAAMDERIADKLEAEARKLSSWADYLSERAGKGDGKP